MDDLHLTTHAMQRMSQRGITRSMIEFTLENGEIDGDKYFLNRKILKKLLKSIDKHKQLFRDARRLILKLMDKGGLTVVYDNACVITAYNF